MQRGNFEALLSLGSPRPSTEPKTPKPRKVSKKSPERRSGPPTLDPKKFPKKPEKFKKIVDSN